MIAPRWFAAFIVASLALIGCSTAPSEPIALTIKTAKARQELRVELALTQAQYDLGLAGRTQIAPNGGMLFPIMPPCDAGFWMKDMTIPLDLVFIRTNGTILRVAENAAPQSRTPIYPGEAVGAVLEIAGGQAKRLGIAAGDRVMWHISGIVEARSSCAKSKR